MASTSMNVITSAEDLEKYRVDVPEDVWPASSSRPEMSAPGQDGFFYIPNFISEDEERYLIQKIQDAPQPKWKTLQNRSGHPICRLQYWGGQVSASSSKGSVLIPEPLPDFMVRFPPLINRIAQTGAFAGSAHGEPNHCLVNEYEPGQGIMPHEDGDAYWPSVATVSTGGHALLDIYRWVVEKEVGGGGEDDGVKKGGGGKAREQEPVFSILQEPRSLLVTTGAAYRDFLHGIAERTRDEAAHLQKVVNVAALQDEEIKARVKAVAASSGDAGCDHDVLVRDTRYSLTFRDVEKVSKGLAGLLKKR